MGAPKPLPPDVDAALNDLVEGTIGSLRAKRPGYRRSHIKAHLERTFRRSVAEDFEAVWKEDSNG